MKQNNIFKPTLKFSEKMSVSNVNVSNDNFRLSESGIPGYVVKFDSTVAKTGTQIIRRGHIHLQNNHIRTHSSVHWALFLIHSASEYIKL